MNPQTFRSWLSERGCTFEQTERNRGEGIAAVTVKCGSRRSEMPDAASHKDLPEEDCAVSWKNSIFHSTNCRGRRAESDVGPPCVEAVMELHRAGAH